jgi:hypothetical protein
MRNPQPDQTCGRKDRGGWGRSCYPRPPSGCGTERSGSDGSLDKVRGACAEATMTRGVIRTCSYLEKVGTLLSIACENVSAMCMVIESNITEQSASRPPFVAKLPPGAHRLLSCCTLAGLLPQDILPPKIAAFQSAQTQWALEGRGKGKTPMTSDRCQKNIPFSKPILIDGNVRFDLVVRSSDGSACEEDLCSFGNRWQLLERKKAGRVNEEKGNGLAASRDEMTGPDASTAHVAGQSEYKQKSL